MPGLIFFKETKVLHPYTIVLVTFLYKILSAKKAIIFFDYIIFQFLFILNLTVTDFIAIETGTVVIIDASLI